MRRTRAWPAALLLMAVAHAEPQPANVSFISCPIYRDTDAGRKSGCWLAEDASTGLRYDISEGPAKPQAGRQVLVEGLVIQGQEGCGASVLRPVRTSVLPESCPVILIPAEGHAGRRFSLPPDIVRPTWELRTLPPPPYAVQDFTLLFDFGQDFLIYQYAEIILERAALYAKASNAQLVRVTGYAATQPLAVSDRALAEPLQLARTRAEMATEALLRLGIPRSKLATEWQGSPRPVDGLAAPNPESTKRRVRIRVTPAQ